MTDGEKLAWCAGMIDQGAIRIEQKEIGRFYGVVEVKMSNLAGCKRLESLLRAGEAKVARTQRKENKSGVFHWICQTSRRDASSKDELRRVLQQIKPYLFIHADRADVLLDFCDAQTLSVEAEVYQRYKALPEP